MSRTYFSAMLTDRMSGPDAPETVLALPKILRAYFQRHRPLLKHLCTVAHQSLTLYLRSALGKSTVQELASTRMNSSTSGKQHPSAQKKDAVMFLHLCCEGWVRFGPFRWLSLQDIRRAFVDETGQVVAFWDIDCWRTTDPRYGGYAWQNPTITVGVHHPHPKNSSHPHFET